MVFNINHEVTKSLNCAIPSPAKCVGEKAKWKTPNCFDFDAKKISASSFNFSNRAASYANQCLGRFELEINKKTTVMQKAEDGGRWYGTRIARRDSLKNSR